MSDGFLIDMTDRNMQWFAYLCQMKGRLNLELSGLKFRDSTLQHLKATGVIKSSVRTKKAALAIVLARIEGMHEAKRLEFCPVTQLWECEERNCELHYMSAPIHVIENRELRLSECEYGCKIFACSCGGEHVVHSATYGCPTGKRLAHIPLNVR